MFYEGGLLDLKEYDVAVIGGGPGGYVAAVRSSQLGLSTVLVEKDALGGTCVNWGCIPTKSLVRNAEVIHLVHSGKQYGFSCNDIVADYAAAQFRSRQISKRQGKRVELLLKGRNVDVLKGQASLIDENRLEIQPSGETILAKNIILATGSSPRCLSGIEFDGDQILTARDALQLTQAPKSVIIVGAGPIGMEFAGIWRRYGSAVTVVEMMPQPLPAEDAEISREAGMFFHNAGITVKTGVRVTSVSKSETGVSVTLLQGETEEVLHAEKILVAAGFIPNIAELQLDRLGVETNRGHVIVDEQMRTNLPHIYAIGDITGKLGLAHVASAQGVIAAEAIAGHRTEPLVYENIPRCTFSAIEIASVGLTQTEAEKRGYDLLVQKSPFVPNGKALALGENVGFVKILADVGTRKLLGIHMIGPHVTELISGPAALLSLGATIDQLRHLVYPHPTLSEVFHEGIHAITGHGIHL